MGQGIIDTWARLRSQEIFKWGTNDCHWLLFDFVKITAQYEDKHNIEQYRGTYNNYFGACSLARKLDIPGMVKEAGYEEVDDTPQSGDIIMVTLEDQPYDMYMPVIHNANVIVGDAEQKIVRIRNLAVLDYDYIVLRRK